MAVHLGGFTVLAVLMAAVVSAMAHVLLLAPRPGRTKPERPFGTGAKWMPVNTRITVGLRLICANSSNL